MNQIPTLTTIVFDSGLIPPLFRMAQEELMGFDGKNSELPHTMHLFATLCDLAQARKGYRGELFPTVRVLERAIQAAIAWRVQAQFSLQLRPAETTFCYYRDQLLALEPVCRIDAARAG